MNGRPRAIARIPRETGLPLSPDQESQLRMEPVTRNRSGQDLPNHTRLTLQLDGALDRQALTAAFQALLERHEAFRTTFHSSSQTDSSGASRTRLHQSIQSAATLDVSLVDLEAIDRTAQDDALREAVVADTIRPFDYAVAPLMRAALIRLNPTRHVLSVVVHHLISDYLSLQIVRSDLETFYDAFSTGHAPALAPLRVQYVDFAAWQRARLNGRTGADLLAFWREYWSRWGAAMLDVRDLSICRPQATASRADSGYASATLDAASTAQVKALTRDARLTFYMTCLAAANLVFYSYCRHPRIALWSRFGNRQATGVEGIVGWLATVHLVGVEVDEGVRIADFLQHVRAAALGAYAHQELPFSMVLRGVLAQDRTSGRSYQLSDPIPFVTFDVRTQVRSSAGGLDVTPVVLPREHSPNDLELIVFDDGDSLPLVARYAPRWFDGDAMQPLLQRFARMLALMAASPDATVGALITAAGSP